MSTSPGPWECRDSTQVYAGDRHVADCAHDSSLRSDGSTDGDNAQLCAAAWGMREVLRHAVACAQQRAPVEQWLPLAREVLAQADGTKQIPRRSWRYDLPRRAIIRERPELPPEKRWTVGMHNVVGGLIGHAAPTRQEVEDWFHFNDLRLVLEHGIPPALLGGIEPRSYV